MSDHYEVKQLAHKDGIFDVSVGYFYEDITRRICLIIQLIQTQENLIMTQT